jgi:hypothetical protein
MPALIRGDRLLPATRAEVLSAFLYRWTVENERRARESQPWLAHELPIVEPAMLTDAEWLASSAFYVNDDGTLTADRHADLAAQAPHPLCICCKWTLRPQDHANPIPGTATFKCDMCAHGWGACCKERRT